MPAPLRRGELRPRRYIAKFPSIGGVPAGRGGKRVRDWVLSLLSPRGLTTGPRSLKSRATRGQIYDDHIFYIPRILNLNLLTQINLYTWILGSSPRMTRKRMSQDDKEYGAPAPRMTENTAERVSARAMTTPPACHPRKLLFSRGPICRHPSAEGNLDRDGT